MIPMAVLPFILKYLNSELNGCNSMMLLQIL